MPKSSLTVDQLCDEIENLSPNKFRLLNQTLDQKRRDRLKAVVDKTRRQASGTPPDKAERIIEEAILEVRTENASHGRT